MKNRLTTNNLTVSIANKTICRHLNLEIKAGDVWGILGPNGSGKTTLLHTLAGLHAPAQGEITLHGKKLTTIPNKQRAREIGVLFQDSSFIFPQSVYDYCLSGRHPHLAHFMRETAEDHRITQQALAVMGLGNKLQQNVLSLSGGERRRLMVATLLAQVPHLYLLDEPTNHLDIRHQIKILNYFKHLADNHSASIMMSLHDINLAYHYCNKVLLLFGDGEILQGPTQNICTKENLSHLYQYPLQAFALSERMPELFN